MNSGALGGVRVAQAFCDDGRWEGGRDVGATSPQSRLLLSFFQTNPPRSWERGGSPGYGLSYWSFLPHRSSGPSAFVSVITLGWKRGSGKESAVRFKHPPSI